jgi:hypothetical protein
MLPPQVASGDIFRLGVEAAPLEVGVVSDSNLLLVNELIEEIMPFEIDVEDSMLLSEADAEEALDAGAE